MTNKNKSEQCGGTNANFTLDTSRHIGGMPVVHGFDLTEFNNQTFSGGANNNKKTNKRTNKTKSKTNKKRTKQFSKKTKKQKLKTKRKTKRKSTVNTKKTKSKKNMWNLFGLKGGMASKYPFKGDNSNFTMDGVNFTSGSDTWSVNDR